MKQTLNLESILQDKNSSRADQIRMVLRMSLPAILAELTSIAMQYIDAGMVGSLGANATASIGLVTSSTWLLGGMCIGLGTGFTIQVAQLIGAGRAKEASDILRQSLTVLLCVGIFISILGMSVSRFLPVWLGGEADIIKDAGTYFLIYSASIPFSLMRQLSAGMMQATGDMRTPSILSALVCALDVVFNLFLIFPSGTIVIPGLSVALPGAGLGVTGAAVGTALSEVVIAFIMLYAVCIRNRKIALRNKGSWKWKKRVIRTAAKIALPLSMDQIFLCSAYVAGTMIVAPLGTTAVAANSLAVTAESICYMPGYGIGAAATAIIGQTIGAVRTDLTRSFSRVSVYLGMILMGLTGALMYLAAPAVFSLLTSDAEVAALGTQVLRIELLAEPFYAASICCAGVFRGAGDTLVPSIMNLVSMWCVRILLAHFLVPSMGLNGYWLAMGIELTFRGIIFLVRMYSGRWMKKSLV